MLRFAVVGWLLLLAFCSFAQEPVPDASKVLQTAYAQAQKEGKHVLVIFHASWCGWCRKMDATLQDEQVKPLVDAHYVTTHLTVYESAAKKHLENPGALAFLTGQGGADFGLPYWIILDAQGKRLADAQYAPGKNTGCPANEVEVAHFVQVLQRTSALKADQLQVIARRFRENE